MFLKSLSIKGFKSFADPAVLELEPGVTVVVGPNGSGKSNVVDAVAWVLGAQGPRTVRSAKMEDVIFMGTASRPALGRAEVALTIDNSAGKLPTDLAEITITRTLFRSGDSEYAINGTPCRLLDVQELLSDTGVGRQQHVIIGQGQLDAILNARPEDRRAVIEEAAGVLKYRRRRERSERRLAATEENLERLGDLTREVRRQVRPLERQAAAARSHADLVAERRALRLWMAGVELSALEARHSEGTEVQRSLRSAEAALRTSLAQLDEATQRTTDELSAQREGDVASALARVEGLVERARGLVRVCRERQRSLAQALDAAADADVVSTLEAEGARLADELADAESEVASLEGRGDELAEAVADAQAALAAHVAQTGDGSHLRAAEEQATVARERAGALEREVVRERQLLDQLANRLASAGRHVGELDGDEHELAERLAATEQERHRLQAAVADTETTRQMATRRLESAEETLRQAEQEHHRAAARAEALGRVLDEARGAAGAELLADVEGVVGTLLDLVEVEEGWEEAFEAAAGSSLTAVVVSGSRAARVALDRLRQGEATGAVLALSASVAVGVDADVPGASEPVRRHVRPRPGRSDEADLGVLLDTLLATAVCCDGGWTAAIDLALGRPDLVVVTRDGDRFSSAGWRVRAGGNVVTAAAVEEAEARAARAEVEARRAAEERRAARAALEVAIAAAGEAVRADDRNEGAHQTARAARQRVATERAALAASMAEDERARAEAEARLARVTEQLAEVRQAVVSTEAARREAFAAAETARQERGGLEEALAHAVDQRHAWEARLAGLAERQRVLRERLAEVERRLTGHADERVEAAERRQRIEADVRAVEGLRALVDEAQLSLDAMVRALRERHRRQLEAVRAGGVKLDDLRQRRSATEHELAATQSRLQAVELELAEATLRAEAVVDALGRDLGATAEEALGAPTPALPEGVDAAARAEAIDARLAALGPVNPLALEELAALTERAELLESQVEDVRRARRDLNQVIRTLDEQIMDVFASAFADVNEHFSALISTLFPGGTGRLSLTDPEHLLDTGVEVEVRPAGRNVRRLSLLSGGERSLVALAFLFAVFRSRPSPFYLMDEVEAALDDVNLQRFLSLIHEFRDEAQLIIVSHQKRTMEAGDALYGVTMAPGGSSKVVSQKVPRHLDDGQSRPQEVGVDSGAGGDVGSIDPAREPGVVRDGGSR